MKVQYFDLGLHVDATELGWMAKVVLPNLGVDWSAYGFEASPEYFKSASARFGGNPRVEVMNLAVGMVDSPYEHLYKSSVDGGDSLYATKDNALRESVLVPVTKLSTWIARRGLVLDGNLNVLRFNIEGSEWALMNDLELSGLVGKFAVYAGSEQADMLKVASLRGLYEDYLQILSRNEIVVQPYCAGQIGNIDMGKLLRELLGNG